MLEYVKSRRRAARGMRASGSCKPASVCKGFVSDTSPSRMMYSFCEGESGGEHAVGRLPSLAEPSKNVRWMCERRAHSSSME